MRFDWDQANRDKIDGQHRVDPEEVEEAWADPDRVDGRTYRGQHAGRAESRRTFIGATEKGRLLFVVYTIRQARIRPITAYDATPQQRDQYFA